MARSPSAKKRGKSAGKKGSEERARKAEAELRRVKAELKRAKARESRAQERKKRLRKKRGPAEAKERKYKSKIGKVTHISARELEGEPQYTWKELEEKSAGKLGRTKKGRPKRWARLVIELGRESLLRPNEYRRLRGKPILRTSWHPAHELLGKAVGVVDQLQRSGAVTPRMKVVIVESAKRPPGRVF